MRPSAGMELATANSFIIWLKCFQSGYFPFFKLKMQWKERFGKYDFYLTKTMPNYSSIPAIASLIKLIHHKTIGSSTEPIFICQFDVLPTRQCYLTTAVTFFSPKDV
jgi:hypothetical protein